MDDLLALIEDCPKSTEDTSLTDSINKIHSNSNTSKSVHRDVVSSKSGRVYKKKQLEIAPAAKGQNANNNNNNNQSSTICPLTRIRIINRQTSKVDIVDILAPYTFHPTGILSSMTKQALSSIVIPNSNNMDTLSGKTIAATMGIVFKNSGTCISKKNGRAFTILNIGDLHTGPTISIMMFGEAYSNFVTRIKSGNVVAFVGMNLLPMKDNYGKETRMTLSVCDVDQVIFVGTAMDYGICAGQINSKSGNNSGGYQPYHNQQRLHNGKKKRCKNYIDLRISKFCQYHIRQQTQSHKQPNSNGRSSSTHNIVGSNIKSTMKKGNLSAIQAMKADRAETQLLRRQMTHGRNDMSSQIHQQNSNKIAMTMVMPKHGSTQAKSIVTHVPKEPSVNNNERFLTNVPRNMAKGTQAFSSNVYDIASGVRNPYTKIKQSIPQASSSIRKKTALNNGDLLGQALNTQSTRQSQFVTKQHNVVKSITGQAKRKKYVPSHAKGFDGQVFVPKPNPLFSRKATPVVTNASMHSSSSVTPSSSQCFAVTPSPTSKVMMLEKQRKLAELRSAQSQERSNTHSIPNSVQQKNTSSKSSTNLFDNFLGSSSQMSDIERTEILQSKSKYEFEANAEAFAKNRNMLTQLEKREMTHDKRNEKKNKGGNRETINNNIVMQWVCKTCKRSTGIRPNVCLRQNHVVKRRREIKKNETAVKKRLGVRTKSIEDGGLMIGSGLEWSDWKNK